MKKGILDVIVLMLFFVVLSSFALGTHTSSVFIGPDSLYETNNAEFFVWVGNDFGSVHSIRNVTVYHPGFTMTSVQNPSSWLSDGDINWYNGLISSDGSQAFRFYATADLVNANSTYSWTVTTTDENGDSQTSTIPIGIWDDINPPSIYSIFPEDYSFIRNDSVYFYVNVQELETSIPNDFYLSYDDNDVMTTSGAVVDNIQVNNIGGNTFSASWTPDQNLKPFIDYRIVGLSDAAGNNYDEGLDLPHHLYLDKDAPVVVLNQPVDNYLTNQYLHDVIFNMSDNSFETNGQGLFRPEVNCTANVQGVEYGPNSFTDDVNNAIISINLTGLGDDYYNFFVYCMDKAGYFSMSEFRTIRLDTTGPIITLNEPANGSIISSGSLITLSVTDTIAGIDLVWYNNGSANFDLFDGSGESGAGIVIDSSGWEEGANNIIIYANDTLSNLATPLSLTFFVDKTPPTVNLVSPLDGELTNGSIDFMFNAVDNYDTILDCSLYIDGNLISGVSAQSGQDSVINPGLAPSDGSYEWYVECRDDAYLYGISEIWGIDVDMTPPELSDITPFNSLNGTNDDDGLVNINFDVIDDNGLSSCELYIDNVLNMTDTLVDFNIELSASNNPYTISIGCNDSVNNWYYIPNLILYYDNIAPNIFNVTNSSITTSNAIVSWSTDEDATRNITYWINPNSTLSSSLIVYEQSHSIALSGLSSSTIYSYSVSSGDIWGNMNTLAGFSFTTLAAPASPSGSSGGGGSGGGGSGSRCVENWSCGAWNDCTRDGILGVQTRSCIDLNNCGTEDYKPALLQNCKLSFEEEQIQENPVEKVQEEIKEIGSITGGVVANVINSTFFKALIAALIIGLLIAGFLRWMKERPPKKINIVDYRDDGDTPFSNE